MPLRAHLWESDVGVFKGESGARPCGRAPACCASASAIMCLALNCPLKATRFTYFHVNNHPNWQNSSSAKRLFSNNYPKQLSQTQSGASWRFVGGEAPHPWICFIFFFKRRSFTFIEALLKDLRPKASFSKCSLLQGKGQALITRGFLSAGSLLPVMSLPAASISAMSIHRAGDFLPQR